VTGLPGTRSGRASRLPRDRSLIAPIAAAAKPSQGRNCSLRRQLGLGSATAASAAAIFAPLPHVSST